MWHGQRSGRAFLQIMRQQALSVLLTLTLASPVLAQVAMPDATQMSGLPLPAGDLPNGAVTVRVVRERMGNNLAGQTVTLTGGGQTKSGITDAQGRAQFDGFATGTTVTADFDSPAPLRVTVCPVMLLPIRSRTTRTVTVVLGNSGAGKGTPDNWLASGMATCASAGTATAIASRRPKACCRMICKNARPDRWPCHTRRPRLPQLGARRRSCRPKRLARRRKPSRAAS